MSTYEVYSFCKPKAFIKQQQQQKVRIHTSIHPLYIDSIYIFLKIRFYFTILWKDFKRWLITRIYVNYAWFVERWHNFSMLLLSHTASFLLKRKYIVVCFNVAYILYGSNVYYGNIWFMICIFHYYFTWPHQRILIYVKSRARRTLNVCSVI